MDDQCTVCVVAEGRAAWAELERDTAELLVAATAADPATWRDLRCALGRWMPVERAEVFLDDWTPGPCNGRADSFVVLDLEGRHVVTSPDWVHDEGKSAARLLDEYGIKSTRYLGYCVPPYWEVEPAADNSRGDACGVAAQAALDRPIGPATTGYRGAMYGELVEFIARRSHDVLWGDGDVPGLLTSSEVKVEDWFDSGHLARAARGVHVDWLTTPRTSLGGRTPADVLNEDQDFIESDILNQEHRWTLRLEAPPGVPRDSRAYRLAPFGPQEAILYHRLIRELIEECWRLLVDVAGPVENLGDLIEVLRDVHRRWATEPRASLMNRSPCFVIDRERSRMPIALAPEEAMVDCDCPVCQMMADSSVPSFWALDDFELSEYFTGLDYMGGTFVECDDAPDELGDIDEGIEMAELAKMTVINDMESLTDKTWNYSYINMKAVANEPVSVARSMLAIGIAGHVGELMDDLRSAAKDGEELKLLTNSFADVRKAIAERNSWSIRSAVADTIGCLEGISERHSPLACKCEDLQAKLELYSCMWAED